MSVLAGEAHPALVLRTPSVRQRTVIVTALRYLLMAALPYAELMKRTNPMKTLKLFTVALLLAQLTGCVSVERPAEKEKEKEKVIVVPERNY